MLGLEKLLGKKPELWLTWTLIEMKQFEQRRSIGIKKRLAYELIKNIGRRHLDIVRLGRQHEQDGGLIFTQHNARHDNPQHL